MCVVGILFLIGYEGWLWEGSETLRPKVKQLALWRQEQRWKETDECRKKGTELIKMGVGGEEIMK